MREIISHSDPDNVFFASNFFVDDSSYIEHMNKFHGLRVGTAGAKTDESGGLSRM